MNAENGIYSKPSQIGLGQKGNARWRQTNWLFTGMSNFFGEQGRTKVSAEAYIEYVAQVESVSHSTGQARGKHSASEKGPFQDGN
jgi:hypothetical protein